MNIQIAEAYLDIELVQVVIFPEGKWEILSLLPSTTLDAYTNPHTDTNIPEQECRFGLGSIGDTMNLKKEKKLMLFPAFVCLHQSNKEQIMINLVVLS